MISTAMIILYINNMDTSLIFYKEAIGLKVISESPYWSTFRINDGLELALHPDIKKGESRDQPHAFDSGKTTLSLTVNDLDAYVARIIEHGGRLERVVEPVDGRRSRMGLVFDPSGNGFQVNQIVQ